VRNAKITPDDAKAAAATVNKPKNSRPVNNKINYYASFGGINIRTEKKDKIIILSNIVLFSINI
jgi:hypothetical protein